MTLPPTKPSGQPTSAKTPSSQTLKFSKKRLALAFAIAGLSDAIGAFATPLPPIVWVVDIGTALLLFMVLGRQWLLLCRFSAAGSIDLTTRSGGRRLKSAKARNRVGRWRAGSAAGGR